MIQMVLFERPKLPVMHWRSDQWNRSHKDCLYEMFLNCGTTVAQLWHFGCFGPKRRDATFQICVPHAYCLVAIGGLDPPTSRL